MSRLTKYKKVYEKPTYEKTEPSGGGGIGGSLSGVFTPLELMQQPGGMGGSRLGDFGRRLSKKGVTIGGRRFGIMDLLSLNPTIGTVLAAQKYGKKLADMANMPRMNEGGSVYSRPMFQTPQQRAGGGIMAGVAPINETMGPMKMEEGGDPGFLDRIRSYYDENLADIPAGIEYMAKEGDMDIPLFGEGGILFDPDDPLDQLSVGLLVFPPAAAAARLASMGVKGYKLFRQMRKINKAQKQMGIDPSRIEKANPFQADPIKALQGGATTSAIVKGTAEAMDLPEVIADVPEIASMLNEVGQDAKLLEQIDNNGIMGLIQDADVESELADLDRAEQLEERAEQDFDNQVARSIAEAREMGVDTFVNKAGKELAAVTKEELDEFRSLPGNEDLGYTEALRKYLNEKNAMEMNRGGIAMLANGGAASPRARRAQEAREEMMEEEPEYRTDRRGRRTVIKKPEAPTPPPEQSASTNDPGASDEMVETEEPSLIRGFFDQISNMDPATSAGLIALSNARPRGQSAFSAFLQGKLDYEQKVAEIEKDRSSTIPGQIEAYKEIFPDLDQEQLQDLVLGGGKTQERRIEEAALQLMAAYSKNQIYALKESKEPGFIARKALADATRFISGEDIPQGKDNSLSEEKFKEYAKELGLD